MGMVARRRWVRSKKAMRTSRSRGEETERPGRPTRYPSAFLIWRVFLKDVLECARCHGRMEIVTAGEHGPDPRAHGIAVCGAQPSVSGRRLLTPTPNRLAGRVPQSWHQVNMEIGAVVWLFTIVFFAAICAVVRFVLGGEFLGAPSWAWGLASTVGVLAGVVAIEGK